MKKIQCPTTIISKGFEEEQFDEIQALHILFQENVKNIIFSASHIENSIAAGIGRYFFGDDAQKRIMLDDLVVSTDFFSFSVKRKVFLSIVKSQNILEGAALNGFEKLISSIIRYRNMFTHGIPVYSGTLCVLHYFDGVKREKEITDEFLTAVEQEFKKCFVAVEEAIQKIRMI